MALNSKSIAKSSEDFATGNVSKVLVKFAIPAIISLLVAELYNMVDTMFVGKAIGGTAIGALTIAFPVQRLIISIGLLIAVGASTAVARSLGEGDHSKLKHIIANALTLMLISISTIIVIIFVFKNSIIRFLGATDNIFPYANEYISIVILGGVFQCFTAIIGYILTALGNAKANLIATSIGAICNVIIDYFLVIVLSFGVKGAAIATVISQIVSAAYAYYHFLKIKKSFNISLSFNLKGDITKSIIAIGFSTFIIEISDAIVAVILNNVLSAHGDIAIIIVGVISRVSMFMYIAMLGITSAMQPIVAYNYGAENYKRVKEVVKKSTIAVMMTSMVLWAFLLIFARGVIGSFVKETDILVEAVKAFRIVISVFPCVGVYFVAIYYYQAIEEARLSLILSIYRQLLIFIPVLFILIRFFGVMGTWISYPVADIISALTGIYYLKSGLSAMDEMDMDQKEALRKERSIGAAQRSY
ncbi:MATE family efflux transporter [Clostridium sp. MSJ-4]|uniref:Multidrug export protein MepA n=1 Tax=Clostridium simiarum TaxID=2841506 RepID=A0ABS6F261_9CLOT|nr:MATE family efflux transporter [Clostridium simiarum]MBU5591980.1 MATE family efflux transporter [Clostridium simiarum]